MVQTSTRKPPAYEVGWYDLRQAHHNATTWDSAVGDLIEPGYAAVATGTVAPCQDSQN